MRFSRNIFESAPPGRGDEEILEEKLGEISRMTAFDEGDVFTSPEDVREYFTTDSMEFMFGKPCPFSQTLLDEWAQLVIETRAHCEFDDKKK